MKEIEITHVKIRKGKKMVRDRDLRDSIAYGRNWWELPLFFLARHVIKILLESR